MWAGHQAASYLRTSLGDVELHSLKVGGHIETDKHRHQNRYLKNQEDSSRLALGLPFLGDFAAVPCLLEISQQLQSEIFPCGMVINIHHHNGQPSISTRAHMPVSDVPDTLAGNGNMSVQSKNDTGQSVPS